MDDMVQDYIDDATEYFIVYNAPKNPSRQEISKLLRQFEHLGIKSVSNNNMVFSVNGYFYEVCETWKQTSKNWSLNYDSGFIDEFMDR